ncbi:MAG: ABC transporter substrate-binding protein [Betaproteobacteria bacterium]|nr:ABC transporter substrate-binding protein [Betaproteobacteria bacterium]
MMISTVMRWCAALAVVVVAAGAAWAQGAPAKVTIAIFGPPSLGSFLPPVIKARKFDIGNGLDLSFVERPPDAYAVQFNSGEFQVGGSASALILANARNRGVRVVYLFNLFDFWGALVTSNNEVRTLKDLVGKEIAAARGTTNFVMIDWFARRQGFDLSKAAVLNTAPAGLMSYAMAGRADAVHLWEPGYTQLVTKKPTVRTLDLDIKRQWKRFAGSEAMPYLGVAAHEGWIKQNPKLVEPLYRTYKAAAEWVLKNPGGAADLILPKGSNDARLAIKLLIESNDRLALNVVGAAEIRKEIESVFEAGLSIKNLDKLPDPGVIYSLPLK